MPGIVRSRRTSSGCARARQLDRLLAVARLADDVEAVLLEQRGERLARQRVIVDDEDALRHQRPYRQRTPLPMRGR